MATVPHARTPQPILDTVEAVLRNHPGGLTPGRIEILVAQRLGSALPTDLPIATVLEDVVAAGRGEWVSASPTAWRLRLFEEGETPPELPTGTTGFFAIEGSALCDPRYLNTFPYRQIDVLYDGRIFVTAVSLTRNSAALQARNWLHDNELVRESRIERNLGGGRWGTTDSYVKVGAERLIRHFDIAAAQLRAQRQARRQTGGAPEREVA